MKKKTREKRGKKNKIDPRIIRIFKFIVLFNVFAIPLYAIMFSNAHWYELQKFTADTSYALLDITGYNPEISGTAIAIPIQNGHWGAMIDWDCVGWKSMLAFFALVFATDFALRKKIKGLIFIPLIYVVNVLRIFFMFAYVKAYGLADYAFVHQIVWSWGLIITIIILWIIWIKYVK